MAKILILDDSPATLAAAKGLLEAAGHTVETQLSPAGLPAIVHREHPDLILLDVNMPTLDGDQMLRILHARGWMADSIVLLFSSKPAAELAVLAESCGASGFISKRDGGEALVATVNSYLEKLQPSSSPQA